jgi:O-methyltransferase
MDAGLVTLLDYQRLAMLSAAVRNTWKIPGDAIEFGTFQGGSAGVILQELDPSKKLHVCDSFEGMPDVSDNDNFHKKGDFRETGADRVRAGLSKLGNNFEMHVGFFSDTIPEMKSDDTLKFSFAHIDVDLYDSIHDCLEFCYPRMQPGGIIIFDDYGAPTCLGAKKAVDEFFASRVETVVPLSEPAYGCVIGGGDAFSELSSSCGIPTNISLVRNWVFPRKSGNASI